MSDELIERAKHGDSDAFAELFKEIQDELYRVAYLYVKNRDDACDVVQETAYRCFKNIRRLKNSGYFRTWAVKIAINCSIDLIRANSKTVPLEDHIETENEAISPESSAEAKELLERLMGLLDEREKSVLLLKYLYELSFSEISKALGLPLGTVKTILYRAMSKIKKEDSL